MEGDCYLVDISDRNVIHLTKKENLLILLELLREHKVVVYEDNNSYSSNLHIKHALSGLDFDKLDDTSILTDTIVSNFDKHMPVRMGKNMTDIAEAVILGCYVTVSEVYDNLHTYTRLQYAKEHMSSLCEGTERLVKFTHLMDDEWYERDLVVYQIGDLPSFAKALSRGMSCVRYRVLKELEMLSILSKYKSTKKSLDS